MPLKIGSLNTLKIKDIWTTLVKLVSEEGEEINLKKNEVEKAVKKGDSIDVFIYPDNDGRLIATTTIPIAMLNEFAFMRVIQETKIGAFLNWGLEKDLLVPFSRQKERMREGSLHLVYVTNDEETDRIVGTTKIESLLNNENLTVKEGEKVDILLCDRSDLGVTVIINNKHWGLLYNNEIFKRINKGEKVKGFVKKIREDGKIDVSLQEQGYDEVLNASKLVFDKLNEEGGFLPVNDKTEPDVIYHLFQMSKKIFKKALGKLYKDRKIEIEDNGIRLKG
jgi:uncharacterized protein